MLTKPVTLATQEVFFLNEQYGPPTEEKVRKIQQRISLPQIKTRNVRMNLASQNIHSAKKNLEKFATRIN